MLTYARKMLAGQVKMVLKYRGMGLAGVFGAPQKPGSRKTTHSPVFFALQPGFSGNSPPFGLRPLGLIDFSDD